jgi:hypothetical protein
MIFFALDEEHNSGHPPGGILDPSYSKISLYTPGADIESWQIESPWSGENWDGDTTELYSGIASSFELALSAYSRGKMGSNQAWQGNCGILLDRSGVADLDHQGDFDSVGYNHFDHWTTAHIRSKTPQIYYCLIGRCV